MADMEMTVDQQDPVELAKAFEAMERVEVSPAEATPDPVAADPSTEPKQDAVTASEADEGVGVATKDGVIPYSVLRATRDRAYAAEQSVKELTDKIAGYDAILASVKNGAKSGEDARAEVASIQQEAQTLSEEDLAMLKEDFPTVDKALTATMQKLAAIEAKLAAVVSRAQHEDAQESRTAANAVQDAIDAVPKLAHLQASDAEGFALAKQFDATLRNLPSWADKTLAQRFSKVAEMVEAATGASISLPEPLTANQLRSSAKATAEAAVRKASGSVPTSLSEFPAGQPIATDERESAERMTYSQLAGKFGKMTPDQMDAYLQTL